MIWFYIRGKLLNAESSHDNSSYSSIHDMYKSKSKSNELAQRCSFRNPQVLSLYFVLLRVVLWSDVYSVLDKHCSVFIRPLSIITLYCLKCTLHDLEKQLTPFLFLFRPFKTFSSYRETTIYLNSNQGTLKYIMHAMLFEFLTIIERFQIEYRGIKNPK